MGNINPTSEYSAIMDIMTQLTEEQMICLNAFLKHFKTEHMITRYNLNRLKERFVYIKGGKLTNNTQICGYSTTDNPISCKISINWGKNSKWNTENGTNRFSQAIKVFNNMVSAYISGFNDFKPIVVEQSDKLIIVDRNNERMALINRISTLFQKRKIAKNDSEFDVLVASSFNKIEPILNQFREAFTNEETEYILLEPVEGKNNAETIAFRSPILSNEFTKLARENPDKQLVIWKDGTYHYLNEVSLKREVYEGSLTTYKEKYTAYKGRVLTNPGHHTQFIIFGIGLFNNQPKQLINDILKVNSNKMPSKDEIERVRTTAKKIEKYKASFMWKDHSVNVYIKKVDQYCDLWLEMINEYPELVYTEETTKVCGLKIQKSWSFCPKCATPLETHE